MKISFLLVLPVAVALTSVDCKHELDCDDACTRIAQCVSSDQAERRSYDGGTGGLAGGGGASGNIDSGSAGAPPEVSLYYEKCVSDCQAAQISSVGKVLNPDKLKCIVESPCTDMLSGKCNDVKTDDSGCSGSDNVGAPTSAASTFPGALFLAFAFLRSVRARRNRYKM